MEVEPTTGPSWPPPRQASISLQGTGQDMSQAEPQQQGVSYWDWKWECLLHHRILRALGTVLGSRPPTQQPPNPPRYTLNSPRPPQPPHPLRSFSTQPTPAGKRDQDTSLPSQGGLWEWGSGNLTGLQFKTGSTAGGHQGSGLLGSAGHPWKRSLIQIKANLQA